MKRIRAALAATCATAFAGPALAEGWVVMDLGETETREICMNRAERVLQDYIDANGGHSVAGDSWTKYGYDLEPGDNDALILCPVVGGGLYNGFLAVYGAFEDSADDHTDQVAEELQRLWDAAGEETSSETAVERASGDLDRALAALDRARAAVDSAQANLREALSGETSDDHGEGGFPPEGEDEEWIDLDEVLQPLKQEFRDGAAPPARRGGDQEAPEAETPEEAPEEIAPQEEAPAEETAPEEERAPAEELDEFEDILPVDPR